MTLNPRILMVDDEVRLSESTRLLLATQNMDVVTLHTGADGLKELLESEYDAFLFDIGLPDMDGFELMNQAMFFQPDTPIIVITGQGTIETAITALQKGAFGFLRKPIEFEELKMTVTNAVDKKRLVEKNKAITVQLKESEKRFRNLVQNSPDMIYRLDPQGCFIFVNAAVERILGYSNRDLVGAPYTSIVAAEDRFASRNSFMEDRVSTLEAKNGEIVTVETSVTPIFAEDGRLAGWQGVDRDISRRRQLEEALADSLCRLRGSHGAAIMGLAKLVEFRDIGTGMHLERIKNYVALLAGAMSKMSKYENYISESYIQEVSQSSILHDIGKVGIPDAILLKEGGLTGPEFEVMKKHCVIGGNALKAIEARIEGQSFLTLGKKIAYCHHENWDGSGYPFGMTGEEIPLSARQVALADVYDALTTKRTYKPAFSHQAAIDIILKERSRKFDPEVTDAFMEVENGFYEISRQLGEVEPQNLDYQAWASSAGPGPLW